MRGIRKMIACMLLLAAVSAAVLPAQAKTVKVTTAKKYELKNVKKAESVKGKWVSQGSAAVFQKVDGELVTEKWIKADGRIYYLNKKGRRVKGWVSYRNNYYYLDGENGLHTGWLKLGKEVYYMLEKNGAMAEGLQKIDGKRYFFSEETGVRMTGWLTIEGSRYYFDEKTGQMQTSTWIKKGTHYYYLDASGKKKTSGWLALGGKTYYLDKTGARVTGTIDLDGQEFYFDENGVYDPGAGKVDVSKPMVALTFDDGPGKYTDRLLNCLRDNGARATFFLVGSNVPYYSSTVKRMAELGCELGNHSYSHTSFTGLSDASIRAELSKTNEAVQKASGKSPTLCRLPYGNGYADSRILSALGMPSIYWSIDTMDWDNTGNPQHTIDAVLNNVKSGDIILMDDIYYSTVTAAETIIPALKKRGYQMVTVSELARFKGKTSLQNGRTYFHFK